MGIEKSGFSGDETLRFPLARVGDMGNIPRGYPPAVGIVRQADVYEQAAARRREARARAGTGGDDMTAARLWLRSTATLRPVADPRLEGHATGDNYPVIGLYSSLRGRELNGEDTGAIRREAAASQQLPEVDWSEPARVGHTKRIPLRNKGCRMSVIYASSTHPDYLNYREEQRTATRELPVLASRSPEAPKTPRNRLARTAIWVGSGLVATAAAAEVVIWVTRR